MTNAADARASLRHGREAAERFGYESHFHARPLGRRPDFRFRKQVTENCAEAYGIRAVMMTALKPVVA